MDRRKRFKLNMEIFRDIFKMCPRVQGQDFDALPTNKEIVSFLRDLGHTREINSLNDVVVDQMHQPWRTFAALINRSLSGKTTVSWRNKIGMHTSKDDYLINTLRFVSTKEETQIYGDILPESLTSPEMKETKAYKTYLGFATGAAPPKKAQKFKKPASPKLTTIPVSTEEPTGKSKRVKRPAKKSTKAPERGVVIRETPEMPLSKKKEKVDVTRGKGIELLSQVALKEDAHFEEVRRKSTRDFHKTRPSGSGAVKIMPLVTSEGTGVKPGVLDVTEEESSENNENESDSEHETDENELGSESSQEEDKDDEEEVKDELVKTPSNDFDDEDETKITDNAEGNEDEEIDYITIQLYDDVDIRLNEPVDADKGFVQEEGTNAAMTNLQQGNENSEIIQVIEDAHVILSTIPQKTEQTPTLLTVPVLVITDTLPVYSTIILQSLPSFTLPPQQLTSIPPPTAGATNPPSTHPNFALVFQFNNRVTTLEKEVAKLKKDPLHTQVIALADDHLDTRLGATRDEFMNLLLATLATRITE
ncbi:hypothetical protein Tco_1160848 [Tanacetum coccineum]